MKIKSVKLLLNHVLTTAWTYESDVKSELIDEDKYEGNFKEYQKVIAVGPNVSTVKAGDIVLVNPKAYLRPVHKPKMDSLTGLMTGDEVSMEVAFPILDINNEPHLFIYDRDIDLIIEDYEEDNPIVEDNKGIIE